MRLLEYIDILIADSILYFTKKLMNPIKMRIEFSSNNFSFYDIFLSLQYPSAQFIFIIKSIRLIDCFIESRIYFINLISYRSFRKLWRSSTTWYPHYVAVAIMSGLSLILMHFSWECSKMFSAVILMSLFQFFFITFPSHYEGLPCPYSYMTLGETKFILPKVNVTYSLNILEKNHRFKNL